MPDQCHKYKENYENLLELKREFDAVIKNGEADGDFSEAKKLCDGILNMMHDLEEGVLYEKMAHKRLFSLYKLAGYSDNDADKASSSCVFDKKNKTIVIKNYIDLSDINSDFELADDIVAEGDMKFIHSNIRTAKSIRTNCNIIFTHSKIKEIHGDIISGDTIDLRRTQIKNITGEIKARVLYLDNTKNLTFIRKLVVKDVVMLAGIGLKSLPDDCYIEGDIVIGSEYKELIESAEKLKEQGKIKGAIRIL